VACRKRTRDGLPVLSLLRPLPDLFLLLKDPINIMLKL
jgi:hypothetical protein